MRAIVFALACLVMAGGVARADEVKPRLRVELPFTPMHTGISSDGSRLVIAEGARIAVINLETGAEVKSNVMMSRVRGVAIEGEVVVAGLEERKGVVQLDSKTLEERKFVEIKEGVWEIERVGDQVLTGTMLVRMSDLSMRSVSGRYGHPGHRGGDVPPGMVMFDGGIWDTATGKLLFLYGDGLEKIAEGNLWDERFQLRLPRLWSVEVLNSYAAIVRVDGTLAGKFGLYRGAPGADVVVVRSTLLREVPGAVAVLRDRRAETLELKSFDVVTARHLKSAKLETKGGAGFEGFGEGSGLMFLEAKGRVLVLAGKQMFVFDTGAADTREANGDDAEDASQLSERVRRLRQENGRLAGQVKLMRELLAERPATRP